MKKLTRRNEIRNPARRNGEASFCGWCTEASGLPECLRALVRGQVTVFVRLSGCLRAVAGPKQFQQIVCGADQLPFRLNLPDPSEQ
jgi:hypothetical protein